MGTAFTDASRPQWLPEGGIWAPCINRVGSQYVLYYSKSVWGGEWDAGIGVATSQSPTGPFTDHGNMFISKGIGIQNCIDPFYIEDGGRKYLFWGSFHGIYGCELSDDGMSLKAGAKPQQVAGSFMEGTYIKRRGGYYYLFGSAGTCCDGERSTYRVTVGRSRSLFGPYVDRQGRPLLDNNFEVVLHRNQRVIGPGHNAELVTDAEGSDWLSVTSDGTQVIVSATANTTGAPRQAKLIFGNGSQKTTIDLTQIEETDFAGVWDMTAFKTFYTKGSASTTNYDSKWSAAGTTPSDGRTDLKIVDGVNYNNKTELNLVNKTGKTVTAYESLNQNSQKATNNVSITGLFENLKTEALTKVDHSAKQATVGIFIDTHTSTKAQRLYTGQYAGEYAALMPELSTKINGGWSFQYATIGGVQYTWYVGTVSVVGHTTTVRWNANTSKMSMLRTSTSAPKLYICGLQVMRYYNNSISSTSMIRQKPGGYSASNFAAYAVTYQGDIVIKRTASGYKDVEIGGGNN